MVEKSPYLPSFHQQSPSPNPISSHFSSCCRVVIGFEIFVKEDGNRPPSLHMRRQTSLASMSSLSSHEKGNPSFRLEKPEIALVVDPSPITTPLGTLAIPNPKQHPLPLAQPEVEKKQKTMAAKPILPPNQVGSVKVRSVFHLHSETKGSSLHSSCSEESACEYPGKLAFLQSCFFCCRSLSMAKDIYMYRGDRAFCSVDCRYQQIVIDERSKRCCVASSMSNDQPRTSTTTYTS